MGFLLRPNKKIIYAKGGYTQYKPKNEDLQRYSLDVNTTYSRLYKPDVFTDFGINFTGFMMWKTRFALGINGRIVPVETYDYFEPRTSDFNRALILPKSYNIGGFVSSDYRKPFAYDVRFSIRDFDAPGRNNISTSINPRIRLSDKFSIFTATTITSITEEPGYVNKILHYR